MNQVMRLLLACTVPALAACAGSPTAEAPTVDGAASTQALKKLPRAASERVAVTIYEFRSSVDEISARGGTDLFKTALVQSGRFRVVERARLNEGVVREKQLNGAGLTSGKSAAAQLTGARYIFEGAITESSGSETQRTGGFTIAGMQIGGSTNRDVIGIDVRIVDAETGDIVNVVTVRKPVAGDSAGISGIGNLIGTARAAKGKSTTYVPDVNLQQQRKESLDAALRAAIDQAVIALADKVPM